MTKKYENTPNPHLNARRVRKLRNFIAELPPKQFAMDQVCRIDRDEETVGAALQPGCGTVACIAGWTILLFSPKRSNLKTSTQPFSWSGDEEAMEFPIIDDTDYFDAVTPTAEFLGLDKSQAEDLCHGQWSVGKVSSNTSAADQGLTNAKVKKLALKELDYLLKTGNV